MRPAPVTRAASGRVVELADAVGGEVRAVDGADCWYIERAFEQVCPDHGLRAVDLRGPRRYAPPSGEPLIIDPARAFLFDIETGGFSGTPVFLIGVVALDEWPPRVVQWLARDYVEERAILVHMAEWIRGRDSWVSFNGKSFDEPFVRDRSTIHRVRLDRNRQHLDLLHAARRKWRGELPNCRLETLEHHILDRRRVGDVPSSDVPDLFHYFFKTGNAGPLRPVLEHNQIDLISCVELYVRLTQKVGI